MSAVAALAVTSPFAVIAISELTAPAPQHHDFVQASVVTDLPNELMSALSQGLSQFGINLPPLPTGLSPSGAQPISAGPGADGTRADRARLLPGLTPGLTSTPGLTPGLNRPRPRSIDRRRADQPGTHARGARRHTGPDDPRHTWYGTHAGVDDPAGGHPEPGADRTERLSGDDAGPRPAH